MIELAYCNVENLDLEKSYELIPKARKNKIKRFKFHKDKCLSCGAYLLLKKLLDEKNIKNPKFITGKYGKTYISNYNNLYFNLSHSNKFVACAISDKEVGVDIEYIDSKIDLNIAKNYFFNEEYDKIINSKNPINEFFKYWVLKESYIKYTGLGFNLKLDSFQIIIDEKIRLKNNNNIKFNLFNLDKYKLAIASKYDLKICQEYSVDELY